MDDLQCVQLVAKEHHRRKRRLEKLNKIKRTKFLKIHKKMHTTRYRKAGYILTNHMHDDLHLEQELHHMHMQSHVEQHSCYMFGESTTSNTVPLTLHIPSTMTISTASVVSPTLSALSVSSAPLLHPSYFMHPAQLHHFHHVRTLRNCRSSRSCDDNALCRHHSHNNSSEDDDSDDEEDGEEHKQDNYNDETLRRSLGEETLSSYFRTIEHRLYESPVINLCLSNSCIDNMAALYGTHEEQCHVRSILRSARALSVNHSQVVTIGSSLSELIHIFRHELTTYPLDIIYLISELVGSAVIWLRRPGLNIFKWCANAEFFFSGYIGCDQQMFNVPFLATNRTHYVDLDWAFVVFVLAGLVPATHNHYFKCYFNQKLLSAFPGTYPLQFLLEKA